jgi:tetratricopeptide (TPR) repeat protein
LPKAKKKGQRRVGRRANDSDPVFMLGARSVERTTAHIARVVSEREFESEDALNAYLQSIIDEEVIAPAVTPLEQAQDLMYDAWEAPSAKRGAALARKALSICPDCADAYVLLAQESADSLQEARDLFAQGVAAGERALGQEAFRECEGHFWGFVETRPYMRARQGLAQCLWLLGEREAAVADYQEMLRLNPNDNQGIRYILAACLLDLGRDEELVQLLDRFEDDGTAVWEYTRALVDFRSRGGSRRGDRLLRAAFKVNPYVPPFLLGKRRLPRRLPAYIGFGDEDEAIAYIVEFGEGWMATPGALPWLAARWEGLLSGGSPSAQGRR